MSQSYFIWVVTFDELNTLIFSAQNVYNIINKIMEDNLGNVDSIIDINRIELTSLSYDYENIIQV